MRWNFFRHALGNQHLVKRIAMGSKLKLSFLREALIMISAIRPVEHLIDFRIFIIKFFRNNDLSFQQTELSFSFKLVRHQINQR